MGSEVGVKKQETVNNDIKFCLPHSISQEQYIISLGYLVHMCIMMISSNFFDFSKSWLFWFFVDKRAKKDLKLPISACFALYLKCFRWNHQNFDNEMYRCFSLYFFKKCIIVNIKIVLFLFSHFNSFFLIRICFSSSSINVKKKVWDVPHLLHMCVTFRFLSAWVHFREIPHVNFKATSHFLFNLCIILHCHDTWFLCNNNYIHHTPYLRNSTSSYQKFLHTYVKWWYRQAFFLFFFVLFFFLGF